MNVFFHFKYLLHTKVWLNKMSNNCLFVSACCEIQCSIFKRVRVTKIQGRSVTTECAANLGDWSHCDGTSFPCGLFTLFIQGHIYVWSTFIVDTNKILAPLRIAKAIISSGSNIFQTGSAPNPRVGVPTYCFKHFVKKTALKWKKLDREGWCAFLASLWIHQW